MFKILDIKKTKKRNKNYFFIEVKFSHSGEHGKDFHFGHLDKYFKALVMLDRQKYEDHYNNLPEDDMYFEGIDGTDFSTIKFKSESPYDLGYCKNMDCSGSDSVQKLQDGTFKYSQYISSNYITDAAVKQLKEMKQHQDKGFCRYGNYSDQIGAFRSGDPFHDFIGILETLDRFWD
jgi:hypothetical protein